MKDKDFAYKVAFIGVVGLIITVMLILISK